MYSHLFVFVSVFAFVGRQRWCWSNGMWTRWRLTRRLLSGAMNLLRVTTAICSIVEMCPDLQILICEYLLSIAPLIFLSYNKPAPPRVTMAKSFRLVTKCSVYLSTNLSLISLIALVPSSKKMTTNFLSC